MHNCGYTVSEDDADTGDVATIQATFLNEPDPVAASFTYNHLGQRVSKTVGTTTTYFIYDEQGNLISELDTNGNTLTDYIYLDGQRIAIVEGNGSTEDIYFTMNDHLGQTYALTNNDGTSSTIVLPSVSLNRELIA